ncbi:MAG TPA: hypothetical protein VFL98_00610 [Candidatus Paceibacterota bacterium]|nr:hypothetical protein [Candidatus Paceibacterota bacterium]
MPRQRTRGASGGTFALWAIGAVVIVVLGFLVSTLFRKTTVTVVPHQHTVVFDESTVYTAYPQSDQNAPAGSLTYTTDSQTLSATTSVTASGTEQVSVPASGTITIYNSYSASPVRLVTNTRFETPDGKVFRIHAPITIPGKSGATPGSITATVYADQPGAEYNIGPVDRFTLPGLESSPDMHAGIYAHSASAMTGGFVGTRPAISDTAKTAAQQQLESQLRAKVAAAYASSTAGYALTNLASISFSALSVESASDGSATVSESANVIVPILPRIQLDSFLASQTSATTGSGSVTIADPSTFSFTLASSTATGTQSLGSDPIDFSLTGTAGFVWNVDTGALANDLAGKNKAAFQAIVKGYASIDSATASVYPLWSQSFPTDPTAIKVVVTAPKTAAAAQ